MMRIGILFGGQAREREISFAGGKTAMAHINKALFKPVPIFVDSLGHFILIKESLILKIQSVIFSLQNNIKQLHFQFTLNL